VSVGEVLSAVELVRRMRAARPLLAVYVSTTTLAGGELAQRRLAGLVDGIFYAPLDYRSMVRRVLRQLRPALVVILETEIWPNLYRESKRAGASLVVVNGRISDRALPRYRKWRWFFRHVLRWPDEIAVQSEQDRTRYIAAGAPLEGVRVTGNLKYSARPPSAVPEEIASFLDRLKPGPVWIAASTMPPADAGDPDEDDAVIEAFQSVAQAYPRLLLILAPRRPERFDTAAEKLSRAGIAFVRRSALVSLTLPGVLLLDSIGELASLFQRATVVFMGGTLAHRGGHNILEPAYFGKPIITGTNMENFAEIDREFTAGGALVKIGSQAELAGAVTDLLRDPRRVAEMGARASELALARRGVDEQAAQSLLRHIGQGLPNPPRTLLARLALTPMSWIWAAGHRINLARGMRARRALDTKVISIGGLSMGGAGKSPLVAHLAARWAANGLVPAILTRGYRRKSAASHAIVRRGSTAPVALTGDEGQIVVTRAHAHVGIGVNRYDLGRRMQQELKPDVFLLDDGFQHVRLKRDHDIVLIDAQDPLSGGLFPLGRRREPLESLARATIVVVTRTERGQDISGIEDLVRRYNPNAPVFRSRVNPLEWVDVAWGTSQPADAMRARRVAAVCGLGSPHGFWHTLRGLGLEVVYSWPFGDHHRYRPGELVRLSKQASAAGAEALVTTEKDVMNLCEGAVALVAPLRMYWLRIGVEIDNEEELLRLIS
jgi:3-deoxy-D-manno-octulosonic-acid transferase